MGLPDHLNCLLRNLYADQKVTVKGQGTTDWFQVGKRVVPQGCILSPCLFNWCTDYIMRKTGLDETQARIKIAERNINRLRYANDTILTAESEKELKSLLMKVRERKNWLKTQHSKNEGHGIWSHHFMANRWETMETVRDFIFLGSIISADGDCIHEIKRRMLLGRKAMTNLDSILKSRDVTLLIKVRLVKAMVFPVVTYGCES